MSVPAISPSQLHLLDRAPHVPNALAALVAFAGTALQSLEAVALIAVVLCDGAELRVLGIEVDLLLRELGLVVGGCLG